ncbi:MAG TPA: signal peptidase II [bacterium]|nr:signal peptidase II [bacterium]HPN43469.1 signal peptidase II [bacterium]
MKKIIWFSIFVIGAAALDIISKFLVLANLEPGVPVNVLGNYLKLHLVFNDGIVFGISVGATPAWLIIIGKLVIISFVVWVFTKIPLYFQDKGQNLARIAFLFIFSGFIGNTFDRFYHGAVVDFIDMGIGNLRWYIYNIADVYIVIGAGLLIITLLKYENKKTPHNS